MKLNKLPTMFLIFVLAGIIFVFFEAWVMVNETSFLMHGIAVGVGFFLVYVSVMLSKMSIKTVKKV